MKKKKNSRSETKKEPETHNRLGQNRRVDGKHPRAKLRLAAALEVHLKVRERRAAHEHDKRVVGLRAVAAVDRLGRVDDRRLARRPRCVVRSSLSFSTADATPRRLDARPPLDPQARRGRLHAVVVGSIYIQGRELAGQAMVVVGDEDDGGLGLGPHHGRRAGGPGVGDSRNAPQAVDVTQRRVVVMIPLVVSSSMIERERERGSEK